jgi:fused signal recognition particle receptor
MGFFTKLKKFWKADNAPDDTAQTPAAAPQPEPAAAAPEPSIAPEPEPASPSEPAPGPLAAPKAAAALPSQPQDAPESTTAPEAAPAPAVAAEPAPVPAAAPTAGSAPVATAPAPQAQSEPEAQSVPTRQPVAPAPAPTAAPAPAAAPLGRPAPAATQAPGGSAPEDAPWRAALILALRQAEPRLSVWLDIVLADVETAGPVLWERLRFLFESLEAPSAEAEAFVAKFADWVAVMEYDEVELFRSELQYRLALALDLEDEEDERNRLLLKLSQGLAKTKEQIVKRIDGMLGRHTVIDEAFWEELEEILLMADVGFEPAAKLLGNLREKVRKRGTTDPAVFKDILREELAEIFRTPKTIRAINPPEVVMMIGVNGVGKTTTIAKLAHRDMMRGKKVLIAAGDTFRAAAIEQLQIWAKRVGAAFYSKGANADPAAVAFEAMDKALAEGFDVLYLDTAGRLHTKTNLMEELRKIHRVVGKKHPGAPHRSVLVLDATTGQNALSQVKLFKEAAGVDEIILTKLDGTAKGGVVVGIALSFAVPITYVGLGEKMEDLRPFDGQDFAQALLGVE